jgi:hypothetical protein
MKFVFSHNNFNVLNLEKSLTFYRKALSLVEVRRYEPPDKSFIIVYLGDGTTPHYLELTWLRDREEPYNLGTMNFIWRSRWKTLPPRMRCMKKWAASVLKTKKWGFTSSTTRMIIGLKSCRQSGRFKPCGKSPLLR